MTRPQQFTFNVVRNCLAKAGIPVIYIPDEEIPENLFDLDAEFLRFNLSGHEFEDTVTNAFNRKGLVASGLSKMKVKVVDLGILNIPGNPNEKTTIDLYRENARSLIGGIHTVNAGRPNEFSYMIFNSGIDEIISSKNAGENPGLHLAVLEHLPKIIADSIDIETHADYAKKNGVRDSSMLASVNTLIHRMQGVIKANGEYYRISTTMSEKNDSQIKAYTYCIHKIKLSPLHPTLGLAGNPVPGAEEGDSESYPVAKLLEGIEKSYDSGKKVLDESDTLTKNLSALFAHSLSRIPKVLQGRIMGWTLNGKIYLTSEGINPYTPIHEYTHLWAMALRELNPTGWDSIKEHLKAHPIWESVKRDAVKDHVNVTEDQITSECLAQLSGFTNASLLESFASRFDMESDDMDKFVDDMMETIGTFWTWTGKHLFEIKKFRSVSEIAGRVLFDILAGTDLKLSQEESDSPEFSVMTTREREALGEIVRRMNGCQDLENGLSGDLPLSPVQMVVDYLDGGRMPFAVNFSCLTKNGETALFSGNRKSDVRISDRSGKSIGVFNFDSCTFRSFKKQKAMRKKGGPNIHF